MSSNGTTTTMPNEETPLVAARRRKAERESAAKEAAEAHELEVLLLEEECIANHGKRGVDWEIVDTDVAVFVVTKPDFIVAKRFNAAKDKSEEEVIQFVLPCVKKPDNMQVRALFVAHGGLAWRCALAALALYEVGGADKRGKY